jgi:chromosome segregation ATPase
VSDNIEQRLTAAAQAVREHEMTGQRCADLSDRQDKLAAELAGLQARYAGEQRDVERLEGVSLTRMLAALTGARGDALARERAEADAARYRVEQAQARLDAVRREHDAARERLGQLATAPATYAALLGEQERHLGQSGDPRGRRLLKLAAERGRLAGELNEVREAVAAARAAEQALAQVETSLDSAAGWSTYDTFFGGGAIASSVKHSRLDEAAQAAAHADESLAILRTELADVADATLAAQLQVSDGAKFVDVWLDNFFSDLAADGRIRHAQQNVAQSQQRVGEVQDRLAARAAQAQDRLAEIEAERRDLLTR